MPKSEVTLETLLGEFKKTNQRLDQIEAKNADRFQLMKDDIHDFRSETNARFDNVEMRLGRIEKKLDATYEQTGRTAEEVAGAKTRLSKLEGPRA